ncbi:MAG: SIMPL domain-containing protein [Betaproteobacteria bacterium]
MGYSKWQRAALAGLVWVALLLVAPAAMAEEPLNNELLVTGEGEVTLRPDVAHVALGIETQAKSVVEAHQENARRSTAVVQRLVSLGVARQMIASTNFNVYPVRVYDEKTKIDRLIGYRVSNRITVTLTDLDKVGAVIDGAVAAGANNVDDVSFSALDPGRAKLEALRQAATEARRKAEVIAEALGAKLGRVIVAAEGAEVGPPVLYERTTLKGAAPQASTPIQAGDLKVQARVTARFTLE